MANQCPSRSYRVLKEATNRAREHISVCLQSKQHIVRTCELQSDAVVNRNYMAASTRCACV